jgi:hypothetical protein
MLVTTLSSHADDNAAESVLATARHGAATDRQGATVSHQGATADCQGAVASRQGAAVDHQGATTNRQGVIAGRQGVTTRCVDRGGHGSHCMDLHASPTMGANCHSL